jgi:hypothetical protein
MTEKMRQNEELRQELLEEQYELLRNREKYEKDDRTLLVGEICKEIKRLSKMDLRVGQIFSNLFSKEDLYYIENHELLLKLKEI